MATPYKPELPTWKGDVQLFFIGVENAFAPFTKLADEHKLSLIFARLPENLQKRLHPAMKDIRKSENCLEHIQQKVEKLMGPSLEQQVINKHANHPPAHFSPMDSFLHYQKQWHNTVVDPAEQKIMLIHSLPPALKIHARRMADTLTLEELASKCEDEYQILHPISTPTSTPTSTSDITRLDNIEANMANIKEQITRLITINQTQHINAVQTTPRDSQRSDDRRAHFRRSDQSPYRPRFISRQPSPFPQETRNNSPRNWCNNHRRFGDSCRRCLHTSEAKLDVCEYPYAPQDTPFQRGNVQRR